MSKISNVRLPNAAVVTYSPEQFNQLIRSLEQVILQLNSTYTPNISEDTLSALAWFGGGAGSLSTGTSGTVVKNYIAVTSAYTVTYQDFMVECTSGTFAVTLLSAAGITGQEFEVKNSGTGTITVTPDGSETIDGAATVVLAQYDAVKVMSNGTNWIVV